MTIRKVVRNKDGGVIHIGEWDFQFHNEPVEEEVTVTIQEKSSLTDEKGEPLTRTVERKETRVSYVTKAANPLPDDAYEDVADVVEGWDGGLYDAKDPARLPPEERKSNK